MLAASPSLLPSAYSHDNNKHRVLTVCYSRARLSLELMLLLQGLNSSRAFAIHCKPNSMACTRTVYYIPFVKNQNLINHSFRYALASPSKSTETLLDQTANGANN